MRSASEEPAPAKQAGALVVALFEAIERVSGNWENNYPHAIKTILQRLASSSEKCWSRASYERIREDVAAELSIEDRTEIDKRFIDRGYQFLMRDGEQLRPSQRGELLNQAMMPGIDVLAAWQGQDGPLLRRMAHNHCLLIPETMLLLRHFAPPGAAPTRLHEFINQVIFCRKLNSFRAPVLRREAEALGILRPDAGKLLLHRVPAPAVACFVVESYLHVGGHRLDVGLPAEAVAMQLSFFLPREDMLGRWQTELGADTALLQREVGGAQVRIDWSGFIWLVAHGMVDPLHVARVLRVHGFDALAREAGERLRPIVTKDQSVNAEAYLAAFLN